MDSLERLKDKADPHHFTCQVMQTLCKVFPWSFFRCLCCYPFPTQSLHSYSHISFPHPTNRQSCKIMGSEVKNASLVYITHNETDRSPVCFQEGVQSQGALGSLSNWHKSWPCVGLQVDSEKSPLVVFRMSASFLNTYLMLSSLLSPIPDTASILRDMNRSGKKWFKV